MTAAKGRPLGPDQVSAILAGLDEGFSSDSAGPRTALLLGSGAKLNVSAGHLHAHDGEGWYRRDRRWNRATSQLSRLVVAADSGYVTLDALRWCQAAGVSLVVVDGEGETTLAPAGGSVDARVLRVQAAAGPELATEAARMLLRAKMTGQAALARDVLGIDAIADTLDSLADALDAATDVDECRQLEASATALYFDTWCQHAATTLRFAKADSGKVPEHWSVFDGRRSVLTNGSYNRRADRPLNALLNLTYHLAMVEIRLAATAVGLSPALAFVHADQAGKDALCFDLIEPVRPAVDRFLLELLAERTFTRRDFVERTDGSIRIAPKLVQEMAATMPMWAKAVAPHAEALAHLLGSAVSGKWQPRTRLTGRNARAASAKVKARKVAAERGAQGGRASAAARRSDPSRAPALFATCVDCEAPLARSRHLRCRSCWDTQPGQARDVRRRRGRAIAASRADLEAWKAANPDARGDPERFAAVIRPGLGDVPLPKIMSACGVSKSTASGFRSGRHTPALRHWPALAVLAGLDPFAQCP